VVATEAKELATAAINGAHQVVNYADDRLRKAIETIGPNEQISFAATDYPLPIFYGLTGIRVTKISDLELTLKHAKELLTKPPRDNLWLPYLGNALDAGVATLFAQEMIEALNSIGSPNPQNGLWLGPASDEIVRSHGKRLIDGTAAGFAVLVGGTSSSNSAKNIALELKEHGFYVFLVGRDNTVSMAEQLQEQDVKLGWDAGLIPLGPRISSHVHTLGFLARIAIILGKINPGDYGRMLEYLREKIFGFYMILGELSEEKNAMAVGATTFGLLTMAKEYLPQLLPIHTLHRLR
jgi:acetyl-CoA synthase